MTTEGIPRAIRESARGWNSSLPVRNPGTITAALMGGSWDVEGEGVLKDPTTCKLLTRMARIDALKQGVGRLVRMIGLFVVTGLRCGRG